MQAAMVIPSPSTFPAGTSLPLSFRRAAAAAAQRLNAAGAGAGEIIVADHHHHQQNGGVVTPPRRRSAAAIICDAADAFIDTHMDPPERRPSADPRIVFSGNFSPVAELPPTPCHVMISGTIPANLAGGAYIRNGPNPQHLLPGRTHNLFDGDGMLHSLLLPSGAGAATFSSRFVGTYKHRLEIAAGGPVFPNYFAGFHGAAGVARAAVLAARALTGQLDPSEGFGLANTSVAFFNEKLYALGESDLPYEVAVSPEDGDVTTLGRDDFAGELVTPMTAHPKRDPATGEVFAFGYGVVSPPFLTYFRFDAAGNKVPGGDVPISSSLAGASFIHDFAVTARFAVFPETQIAIDPMNMALRGGSAVRFAREKVPRLGLLPRYASSESEMRWFDVPGFNMMHAINAWDDDDDGAVVVLVATNLLAVEEMSDGRVELARTRAEMIRIDTRSGEVSRTPVAATASVDFGMVHPGFAGRRCRYAYLGVGSSTPKISEVVKLDLSSNGGSGDCVVAARREFGPGLFAGEPFFVPAAGDEEEEEDEGYLLTYVHNEGTGVSSFVVMDARSPELEVVAEVVLPRRVPYGFHGVFVGRDELRHQQQQRRRSRQ